MERDRRYMITPGGGGLDIAYVAKGRAWRLWGPFETAEEAWAAIPDPTKPPGTEPNLTFFRARGAFAKLSVRGVEALALESVLGVEVVEYRDVVGTSREAQPKDEDRVARTLTMLYDRIEAEGGECVADDLNAWFPTDAASMDRRLTEMRRRGMVRYALDRDGAKRTRKTRSRKSAYVHVIVPRGEWVPVKTVRPPENGATSGNAAERLERMKSTGMSMVPSLRKLRDAVQTRSIGANALSVELTGITDWLETLFKEEMEYGQ